MFFFIHTCNICLWNMQLLEFCMFVQI
ncbi:hypothetical protein O6H91_14G013700 [Diphasiastrum complanatum]|uniref:Uncharacterized protein n=1 Tax=Diphasiastrum complanatum TaxID=34168 RepID=A0ACC2BLM9_DIPCM|nr:hypothetical protein O6H91_14G013700 [Diphasiastrum complanatum]